MNHPNVQATDNRPIIKCESVYKIFGENSKRMLQQVNGQVDTKQFQAAGLVVGVNNCRRDFDVDHKYRIGFPAIAFAHHHCGLCRAGGAIGHRTDHWAVILGVGSSRHSQSDDGGKK